MLARQAGGGEDRVRPIARGDVEPQRTGRIGHVRHLLAGHAQPHLVLGQQHGARRGEGFWLMIAHPHQLGRGEARHGEVAGHRVQVRDRRLQRLALGFAAPVVPEDRGAKRSVVLAQQRRAVHLAGDADAADGAAHRRVDRPHRRLRRVPPCVGMLLRPQRMRPLDGERRHPGGHDAAALVQRDGLDPRGADIDAEEHVSLTSRTGRWSGSTRRGYI